MRTVNAIEIIIMFNRDEWAMSQSYNCKAHFLSESKSNK